MKDTTEAQKLAHAWESTGYPLDGIAEMHLKLKELLEKEKEHSALLESRLAKLHRTVDDYLVSAEAKLLRNIGGYIGTDDMCNC